MAVNRRRTEKIVNAHPIHDEPAFIVEHPKSGIGNILIIADIHYGIEHTIALAGAHLPSQTEVITEHILKLCSKNSVTELILVGDIKHTVPKTSNQEWYELPKVFETLSSALESVHIIPGNHDGGLRKLIPDDLANIELHPNSGAVIHGFGFFHGHTWPAPHVLNPPKAITLMAHNHPHVLFIDKLGGRASYSCWVRGHLNMARAVDRYPGIKDTGPEIIIMPAFNDLGSGTPVNTAKPEFLGPMLKNRFVDIENVNVYLLDGTDLGKLPDIVELSEIKRKHFVN